MNLKKVFSVLALSLGVLAGTSSSVFAAMPSPEEFQRWKAAALKGEAWAQYNLGLCYQKGIYFMEDKAEGFVWLKKAAEQEFPPAMVDLANCYENGTGVKPDKGAAILWLKRVANLGHVKTQYLLGMRYFKGEGVPVDKAEAFRWFTKAAEKGALPAKFYLAYCYMQGEGCELDPKKALELFKEAAQGGLAAAQYNLGLCYYKGTGVEIDEDEAEDWFEKAAESGMAQAQYYYARCLLGDDDEEAVEWLKKAASQNVTAAQYELGKCYAKGIGTEQSVGFAIQHLEKAVEAGHEDAQIYLGVCLRRRNLNDDAARAFALFQQSASRGNAEAQYLLGMCYLNGNGVAKNAKTAETWLEKSSRGNFARATEQLALMRTPLKPAVVATKPVVVATKSENVAAKSGIVLPSSSMVVSAKPKISPVAGTASVAAGASGLALGSVDTDIPHNPRANRPIFVCAIANEDYSYEQDVPFAQNDGEIFVKYAEKTLGVDPKRIRFVKNATLAQVYESVRWLTRRAKHYPNAELIFYYAGHGAPAAGDEENVYLIPSDSSAENASFAGVSLKRIYDEFGKCGAAHVTVFLDACFSGMGRDNKVLASARGVRVAAEPLSPLGKTIVFAAASGSQTAHWLKEKQHGIFTYCLLEKLRETKGKVSYRELGDYLRRRVPQLALDYTDNEQVPACLISSDIADTDILERKIVK